MNYQKYITLCILIFITLFSYAQEITEENSEPVEPQQNIFNKTDSELNNLSLDEIINMFVKTSSKKVENQLVTPAYVNVITAEEIRNLNMNSLEEILEYSVGIGSVTAEGNKFASTTIRGNTTANYNVNTLLLFDGIPIYNPYHGSFDLNTIPLSSIKKIEIVKGANSVLYGTNAINAVINVIPYDAYKNDTEIRGRVRAGSYKTVIANNAILLKKDDFKLNLFSDYFTTYGEPLTYFDQRNGQKFTLQKNLKTINLASIVSYKDLKFHIQYENRSTPALEDNQFYKTIYPTSKDTFQIYAPEKIDEYQVVSSLSYVKKLSESISFNTTVSHQNWQLISDDPDLARKYSSYGTRAITELNISPFSHTNGIIGLEYNNYYGSRLRYGVKNNIYTEYTDVNSKKYQTNDYAIYFNGNSKLNKRLTLSYGSRYYLSHFSNTNFDNLSPRLALVYQILPKLYVKTIYGQSFRTPVYYEKSSDANTSYGNRNLKPETSSSYDLVLSSVFKNIQWELDFFYTKIKNKIVKVNATDEDRINANDPAIITWYKNTESFNYYGLELNTKYDFNSKLKGFFGYSFTQAYNLNDNPKLIGDDPWYFAHMANLGAGFNFYKENQFTISSKVVSNFGPAKSYGLLNLGLNILILEHRNQCELLKLPQDIINSEEYQMSNEYLQKFSLRSKLAVRLVIMLMRIVSYVIYFFISLYTLIAYFDLEMDFSVIVMFVWFVILIMTTRYLASILAVGVLYLYIFSIYMKYRYRQLQKLIEIYLRTGNYYTKNS